MEQIDIAILIMQLEMALDHEDIHGKLQDIIAKLKKDYMP
jgi:hypothetical protein